MSIDWIVIWPEKPKTKTLWMAEYMKPPTTDVVREVLEDFLGGLHTKITEHQPGFLSVGLKGTSSKMFRRHGGDQPKLWGAHSERGFEVWVHNKGLTVTTRMQDDVTNGLAETFARRCAQRWDGCLDEPS